MDYGEVRVAEHIRGCHDLPGLHGQWRGWPVAVRLPEEVGRILGGPIHQILGYIEMDDTGTSVPGRAEGLPDRPEDPPGNTGRAVGSDGGPGTRSR